MGDLARIADPSTFASMDRTVQVSAPPATAAPKSDEEVERVARMRREQGKRLAETAAKKRAEKLTALNAEAAALRRVATGKFTKGELNVRNEREQREAASQLVFFFFVLLLRRNSRSAATRRCRSWSRRWPPSRRTSRRRSIVSWGCRSPRSYPFSLAFFLACSVFSLA